MYGRFDGGPRGRGLTWPSRGVAFAHVFQTELAAGYAAVRQFVVVVVVIMVVVVVVGGR